MHQLKIVSILALFVLATGISAADSAMDREIARLTEKVILDMNAAGESRVAFLDFVDIDGRTTRFGRFLVEELRARFYDSRRFTVVERRALDAVLAEQNLQLTGLITDESAVRIGELLGANTLVTGTVTDLGEEVRVHVRLVGVDSAGVFSVARATFGKDDAVRELMEETISAAPVPGSADSPAAGREPVIQRTTSAELTSRLAVEGEGPFSGSWLLNSSMAMTLVQEGDRVTGRYDRLAGTIRGTVSGRVLTFTWSEDAARQDGTRVEGPGEITLGEDGMFMQGTCRTGNNSFREQWGAIRSQTDPVVQQLVDDSTESRRGRWNGKWLVNTGEPVEIAHTGNLVSAVWKDGGMLYGFIRGERMDFYRVFPSDRRDGTFLGVRGEATLETDGMMFNGTTRHATGTYHNDFRGIRSPADPLVTSHIDNARKGGEHPFDGDWIVNGDRVLRLYQNGGLVHGRWSGTRDVLWGFAEGDSIRFYEVRETPARDGSLQAFSGGGTLSTDLFAFTGTTRWMNGTYRDAMNGVRSLSDPLVEEQIVMAGERPRGGFTGTWVINDRESIEIRQTGEYFVADWKGATLYGTVQGRRATFYGIAESARGDGTETAFLGSGILDENLMAFTGDTRQWNGTFRSAWSGHRSDSDPSVRTWRTEAEVRRDGAFSGEWSLPGVGSVSISHTGDRAFGTVKETGEMIWGFVSGRVWKFYGTQEQPDGSRFGFTGELTLNENLSAFTGQVRWISGTWKATWNATRR